jgi:hypothetical protein
MSENVRELLAAEGGTENFGWELPDEPEAPPDIWLQPYEYGLKKFEILAHMGGLYEPVYGWSGWDGVKWTLVIPSGFGLFLAPCVCHRPRT